jgi:hypothetical protein
MQDRDKKRGKCRKCIIALGERLPGLNMPSYFLFEGINLAAKILVLVCKCGLQVADTLF